MNQAGKGLNFKAACMFDDLEAEGPAVGKTGEA
jgi:hypothetical protein